MKICEEHGNKNLKCQVIDDYILKDCTEQRIVEYWCGACDE